MADDGLRDRLAKQGEDALGKLAQDLLENPLVNGAITRAFEAREKASAGPGGGARRAQHPVGRRRRAAHAPPALGLPAPRGHRGRRRPARRSASPSSRPTARNPLAAVDERLGAIEAQLAKLAADVALLTGAVRRRARAGAARAGAARGRQAGAEGAQAAHQEVRFVLSPRPASAASARAAQLGLGALERLRRRSGAPSATTSLTPPARTAAATPRRGATASSVAASISTASAPACAQPRARVAVGVVEEVGGDDQAGRGRRRPPPRAPPAAPGPAAACRSRRARGSCRPPPARRRRRAASRARARRPARRRCRPARSGARRARSAPRRTIAALGPPIPVLWIVSGSPSGRDARVAPQAAVVVEHLRRLEQQLREPQRAARDRPGSSTRSATSSCGRRWMVAGALTET